MHRNASRPRYRLSTRSRPSRGLKSTWRRGHVRTFRSAFHARIRFARGERRGRLTVDWRPVKRRTVSRKPPIFMPRTSLNRPARGRFAERADRSFRICFREETCCSLVKTRHPALLFLCVLEFFVRSYRLRDSLLFSVSLFFFFH